MAQLLDNASRQRLKARAHRLRPVVLVGQHGVTAAVTAEIALALDHHELIKVRFRGHARDARRAALDSLCENLAAALVQEIGGTATLFRERAAGDGRTRAS